MSVEEGACAGGGLFGPGFFGGYGEAFLFVSEAFFFGGALGVEGEDVVADVVGPAVAPGFLLGAGAGGLVVARGRRFGEAYCENRKIWARGSGRSVPGSLGQSPCGQPASVEAAAEPPITTRYFFE